jgi:uncharacterized protein YqfA (UPF0365 family)
MKEKMQAELDEEKRKVMEAEAKAEAEKAKAEAAEEGKRRVHCTYVVKTDIQVRQFLDTVKFVDC